MATPLIDMAELSSLNQVIAARPVWAAVSTHLSEEEIIIDAHLAIKQQRPGLMTFIIPRHPDRDETSHASRN